MKSSPSPAVFSRAERVGIVVAAATLGERLRAKPGVGAEDAVTVRHRLDAWDDAITRPGESFAAALARAGLDSDRAHGAAAACFRPPRRAPAWLGAVEAAIRAFESTPVLPTERADSLTHLVRIWTLVAERWLDGEDRAAGFSLAARRDLASILAHRLRRVLAVPLAEELAAARAVVGREPSDEVFFCRMQAGGLRAFFRASPTLARLAGTIALHWRGACRQLAAAALAANDAFGGRATRILRVAGPYSDFHGGGRCVLRCTFRRGETWYFKPRSLEVDDAWNAFVRVLRSCGAPHLTPSPRLISTKHGGWQHEADSRPPTSAVEASLACRSVGALLAAVHWLRATDLHPDNVRLGAAGAILLDAETLLHPLRPRPVWMERDNGLRFDWEQSVLRTHAFRCTLGEAGQPAVRAGWFDREGVDTSAQIDFWKAIARWLPDVGRVEVLAGFRETLDRCGRRTPELAAAVARLRRAERRVLWRDTAFFARLLDQALTGAARRDGFARGLVFEACARRTDLPPLSPGERWELEAGDIPRAVTRRAAAKPLSAAAACRAVDEVADLLSRPPVRLRRMDGDEVAVPTGG